LLRGKLTLLKFNCLNIQLKKNNRSEPLGTLGARVKKCALQIGLAGIAQKISHFGHTISIEDKLYVQICGLDYSRISIESINCE